MCLWAASSTCQSRVIESFGGKIESVDGNVKSLSDDVKHFFLERQKNLEGENNMLKEDKKRLQDDLRKSAEAHKTQMKARGGAL